MGFGGGGKCVQTELQFCERNHQTGFLYGQNSGVISERSFGSNSSDQGWVSRQFAVSFTCTNSPLLPAVGVTRLMDLKRETRAKEEQITLVRNRLERLKLEEQKVRLRWDVCVLFGNRRVDSCTLTLLKLLKKTEETNRRAEEILVHPPPPPPSPSSSFFFPFSLLLMPPATIQPSL